MGLFNATYHVNYEPDAVFPLFDFKASYVESGAYTWNQQILNKVLTGQAQPVDYSLYPRYLLVSNLPETNTQGGPIYYASEDQFGTMLGYWQGPSGTAIRQYLQGVYIPVNETFTKH